MRQTGCRKAPKRSGAFQTHGHAHATADAQRGKAALGIATGHFMQQGVQDTAT
jgi:hypothetical protein